MVYIFLILAAVAIALFALGSLSVWVSVLSMALKAALAAAVAVPGVMALMMLWHKFFGRKS